jgi:hypothetical protein
MEVAYLVVEARIVLPRGRDEDGQRLRDVRPFAAHEQLERVVEERRVRPVAVECGCERRLLPERALARLRPGDVAVDRVDLAVVTEQPERLRALPARFRVRREALVEDREREPRIPGPRGRGRNRASWAAAQRALYVTVRKERDAT